MNFRHLEAFVATAQSGSVTHAAEKLLRTQPTVSGQLKELEEELGVSLFHRLPRGVELTAPGRELLHRSQQILNERQKLLDEAAEHQGLLRGELVIHASNIPGEYLLPPLLGRFKKEHPGLRMVCRIYDSAGTIARVLGGEAGLGVVGRTVADPELEFTPLWSDRIELYSAPGVFPEAIPAKEFAHLPLVCRVEGSATRRAVEKALGKLGATLSGDQLLAELGSTAAVKEALRAGVGAAFLSQVAAAPGLAAGTLERVKVTGLEPILRRFYLVEHKRRELSPAARAFKALLLEQMEA
jgi:DNA-binding transcriptional LysR family regulator